MARLVAHEPPLLALLPDGPALLAAADAAFRLAADDPAAAMRAFTDLTRILELTHPDGRVADTLRLPPVDAADRGRSGFFLGRMAPATVHHELRLPDLDPRRLTLAAGAASVGQPARRAAAALADALGVRLHEAPGNHLGFALQPDAFADWLAARFA